MDITVCHQHRYASLVGDWKLCRVEEGYYSIFIMNLHGPVFKQDIIGVSSKLSRVSVIQIISKSLCEASSII